MKKLEKQQKESPVIQNKSENSPEKDNLVAIYEDLLAELPPKQARFVDEYLIDLNGTKAAERSGYKKTNAVKQASEILTNPKVAAAIDAGKRVIARRLRINQDEVIKELCRIGFSNMTDFVDFGPGFVTLKRSATLTEDQARAIAEVSETTTKDGGSVRFKLHDKVKALLGILDRVKPGADDPHRIDVTMVNMPPQPATMEEWMKMAEEMDRIAARDRLKEKQNH